MYYLYVLAALSLRICCISCTITEKHIALFNATLCGVCWLQVFPMLCVIFYEVYLLQSTVCTHFCAKCASRCILQNRKWREANINVHSGEKLSMRTETQFPHFRTL